MAAISPGFVAPPLGRILANGRTQPQLVEFRRRLPNAPNASRLQLRIAQRCDRSEHQRTGLLQAPRGAERILPGTLSSESTPTELLHDAEPRAR
jgi:hypothetical protein